MFLVNEGSDVLVRRHNWTNLLGMWVVELGLGIVLLNVVEERM